MRRRRIKPARASAAVLVLIGGVLSGAGSAGSAPSDAVKAGFVFNFAKFTEWPNGAGKKVRFCFEADSVRPRVYKNWDQKSLRGNDVQANRIRLSRDGLKGCDVAMLNPRMDLPERLTRGARSGNVLLIAEGAGFARAGGHIALIADDSSYRFIVNLEAAQAAGLSFSARLLRLAENVLSKGQ